jgi:hypothetical protein
MSPQSHPTQARRGPNWAQSSSLLQAYFGGGRLYLAEPRRYSALCRRPTERQQDLIYATQGPANAALFEAKVDVQAWKSKRSWYVVALKDGTINTEQEHFMAKRMGGTTVEVDSSHVPMISHDAVVDIIKQASEASAK